MTLKSIEHFPGSLIDIAYYLPEQIIDNSKLQKQHPDWMIKQVEKRTGVYQRRVAKDGETAYDLSLKAAIKLLSVHPSLKKSIDAVIYCTQSPDYIMPSNAFLLQRDLGLGTNILAFDYNLACSGYLYGLVMASSFIKTGIAHNVLLITADTYSKYIDVNDRSTTMLFGDGASASWISEAIDSKSSPIIKSFIDFDFSSDGTGAENFMIKGGGCRYPYLMKTEYSDKIKMDGLQVLNLVNDRVVKQIKKLLSDNGLNINDVEQFLFHQASLLALDGLQKNLKIEKNKAFSNLKNIGNTVSTSLPILLKDYSLNAIDKKNSTILLSAFGVGYSWGSLLASI